MGELVKHIGDAIRPHRRTHAATGTHYPVLSSPFFLPDDADQKKRLVIKLGALAGLSLVFPRVATHLLSESASSPESSGEDGIVRNIETTLQIFGNSLLQFRDYLGRSRDFFSEARGTTINDDDQPFQLTTERYSTDHSSPVREKIMIKLAFARGTHTINEISTGTDTYPVDGPEDPSTLIASVENKFGIRVNPQGRKEAYIVQIKDGVPVPSTDRSTDGQLPIGQRELNSFRDLLTATMNTLL